MKLILTFVGAAIGFVAPITVALASGVQLGTSDAGWFLAMSWFLCIFFGIVSYFALSEQGMG